MAKVDYIEHQRRYEKLFAKEGKLTVAQYCERAGLNYTSAKRHLRKPKATGQAKGTTGRTKAQEKWAALFEEFLIRATKNPSLTITKFAEEKGEKYPTMRRSFNSLRNDPDLAPLIDRYDQQQAEYSDILDDRRNKNSDKTNVVGAGRIATKRSNRKKKCNKKGSSETKNLHQTAINSPKNCTKTAPKPDLKMVQGEAVDVVTQDDEEFVLGLMDKSQRDAIFDTAGLHVVHGGYCQAAGILPETIDLISEIDPLSVSNELLLARARYLKMNQTIASRLAEIDVWEETGDIPTDEEGKPLDINKERDAILFGYTQRLNELESTISTLANLENKRALDIRKQRMEELKLPYHLPMEETQLVIKVLELRERNNWDALTTSKYLERLGAKVPPALVLELKAELNVEDEEIIEGGISTEELDRMSLEYKQEQEAYMAETLPARRKEVAEAIARAEAAENGEEYDAGQIQQAAKDEEQMNEYDQLDTGVLSSSDNEGFEPL